MIDHSYRVLFSANGSDDDHEGPVSVEVDWPHASCMRVSNGLDTARQGWYVDGVL